MSTLDQQIGKFASTVGAEMKSLLSSVTDLRSNLTDLSSTVDTKANASTAVTTNTNQTIAGAKTFSSAPKISVALDESLNDSTIATTEWVTQKVDQIVLTPGLPTTSLDLVDLFEQALAES